MRVAPLALALSLLAPSLAAAGELPDDLSYYDLMDYLEKGNADEREEAADRLGDRKDADAVPKLGEVGQTDDVWEVRRECVDALEEIGTEDAVVFIRKAAEGDDHAKVRMRALEAIAQIDKLDGEATVVRVLGNDDDVDVRMKAAAVIEDREWYGAVPALVATVKTHEDSGLRERCLHVLTEWRKPEGYAAIHHALLEDGEVEIRRKAAAYLEDHPRKDSLDPMSRALLDEDKIVVRHCIDGLQKLGDEGAVEQLRAAAKHIRDDDLVQEMNEAANRLDR